MAKLILFLMRIMVVFNFLVRLEPPNTNYGTIKEEKGQDVNQFKYPLDEKPQFKYSQFSGKKSFEETEKKPSFEYNKPPISPDKKSTSPPKMHSEAKLHNYNYEKPKANIFQNPNYLIQEEKSMTKSASNPILEKADLIIANIQKNKMLENKKIEDLKKNENPMFFSSLNNSPNVSPTRKAESTYVKDFKFNFLENLEKIENNDSKLETRKEIPKEIPVKPKVFNKDSFEIGNCIGKGQFETENNFLCCLKFIDRKKLKEAGNERILALEIKIQTFVTHPNILKLYGFFISGKDMCLVLECAPHGELYKEMKKQDVLKLCDFGWATSISVSKRQTFCGTLDYVSPEIVVGDMYDESVDVWSLGVLCYELCTGKPPFERDNNKETYKSIITGNFEMPAYLSNPVKDLISRILIREPEKRLKMMEILTHPWIVMHNKDIIDKFDRSVKEKVFKLFRK